MFPPIQLRSCPRAFQISWGVAIVGLLGLGGSARSADPPRFEFTRMVAHWTDYGTPDYLKFIEEARPEVAQVGFYGGHFWSLGHTPQFDGYPSHFPVRGLDELGAWFEGLNGKLHDRGVKVVGHFNVEFLVGDPDGPEGPRGFFKFYRDLWDAKALGPKPVADPLSFLEKDAQGQPIKNRTYAIGGMDEYWACLRNPAWREVLKAWVRLGIRRGLDGFIANYFYRHDCLCEHCQAAFRAYLSKRFDAKELRDRFGIEDLATHRFAEIVSWHPPAETTPLRLEMLRFSQVSNKEAFDEVFVKYGRSIKPDLIVAQWNHLGDFSQVDGDERCLLPADLWGRDESYLWYSTGGSACYTDLKERYLGDGTLQARYIRGAFGDRPFTLGKYEATRIRSAIAELAANGGAPMGFYTNFTDPEARAEIVRYYGFLRENDRIYHGNRPHAEVALLFPRTSVHRGEVAAVESFRKLGRALLEAHVLFDVWPDDQFPDDRAAGYPSVVRTSDPLDAAVAGLSDRRSRFEAPFTVRVAASRPAGTSGEIDLHFVNYDRIEPPPGADRRPSPGTGIRDERPLPSTGVKADLLLPDGAKFRSVRFVSPEQDAPTTLDAEFVDGRVRFALPEFLVYGVAQVEYQPRD
ncbi:hypothetical protein P12x_002964 [Tundrisphaera lichenicola]|uniref:hypothetical protein n=1 Tax=Tundrisphaera lichenicola TaxID=2029860 RepID=UPI003EBD5DBB